MRGRAVFHAMSETKPKLVVFDLDYTLWPFWVDTHVNPPFRREKSGTIVDSHNVKIKYYPEAPEVLRRLHREGYALGIASRTGEIDGAHQLVKLFDWQQYFSYSEIYPGSKVAHFNNFKKRSGIEFEDMIFFDDEHRNIRDLSEHGVLSILVPNGITWTVVEKGLRDFADRRKR